MNSSTQSFQSLNASKYMSKLLTSFYKNNLVSVTAKNGHNGCHLGRLIIDLDESKKGLAYSIIRNYLLNVRKSNHILVNKGYFLTQTQLQSDYDNIFTASS